VAGGRLYLERHEVLASGVAVQREVVRVGGRGVYILKRVVMAIVLLLERLTAGGGRWERMCLSPRAVMLLLTRSWEY
jgi:hypothetical protein